MMDEFKPFSLPKCCKHHPKEEKPLFLPPEWPPDQHPPMGDAVDDAYNSMMVSRTALWQKYEADNTTLGNDIARYNQDNDNWNRVSPNMTQPDKTNAFNALSAMYTALSSEAANISAAFNWGVSGDNDRTAGLNSQNAQQKIQLFNSAKGKYDNQATSACNTAEGAHTNVDSNGTTFETIMNNWG